MIALAILASVSFDFRGGTDNELTLALSTRFGRPVVMLAGERSTWKPISESAKTESGLLERLGAFIRIKDQSALGTANLAWPRGFAFKQAVSGYYLGKKIYQGEIGPNESGLISVATKGQQVFQLPQIRVKGYKIHWHWFYASAFLTSQVVKASPDDFYHCVANALGATLTIKDKVVDFKFDPAEFRNRSVAAARPFQSKDPTFFDIEIWFRAEMLKGMSDNDIAVAFAEPTTNTRIVAREGTSLYDACRRRINLKYGNDASIMELLQKNEGDDPIIAAEMKASGVMSVSIRNRNGKWGILL